MPEDSRLERDTETLYKELERVDPVMATRWHPRDHRKIKRALQIFYTTGKKQSDLYSDQREAGRIGPENVRYPTLFFWLWSEQDILDQRLDDRVDDMIDGGMFEELREAYTETEEVPDFTKGIYQSIGYKENLKYLQTGHEQDKREGIEAMKAATRRYARTQIKLIRNKLLLHCREAGNEVHIVLLDATDLTQWNVNVRDRAIAAVKDFLEDPSTFDAARYSPGTELVKTLLRPKVEKEFSANPDAWQRSECDLCPGFVTNSVEGWKEHLDSNRHRAKVRQGKKRAEFERWKAQQTSQQCGRDTAQLRS